MTKIVEGKRYKVEFEGVLASASDCHDNIAVDIGAAPNAWRVTFPRLFWDDNAVRLTIIVEPLGKSDMVWNVDTNPENRATNSGIILHIQGEWAWVNWNNVEREDDQSICLLANLVRA